MHYFIIHQGSDYETYVEPIINRWSGEYFPFKASVLKGTSENSDWHGDARAKIRSADKVIYIVSDKSNINVNIDWELETAFAEKKEIYVYNPNKAWLLNKVLEDAKSKVKEEITEKGEVVFTKNKQKFFLLNDCEIKKRFEEDEKYLSNYLETKFEKSEKIEDIMLKQYEMFVETSEELVRRKQNVNNYYITMNSLLIGIITGALTMEEKVNLGETSIEASIVVVCLLSLVGGIICFSWNSVLQSYADLNSSKMTIISYIESKLAYNLYDTEWQLVSKKMGNRKYKSFSKKERFISKLFLGMYVILLIIGIGLLFI